MWLIGIACSLGAMQEEPQGVTEIHMLDEESMKEALREQSEREIFAKQMMALQKKYTRTSYFFQEVNDSEPDQSE